MSKEETKYDKIIEKLKNNPFVAIVILVFVVIFAVAKGGSAIIDFKEKLYPKKDSESFESNSQTFIEGSDTNTINFNISNKNRYSVNIRKDNNFVYSEAKSANADGDSFQNDIKEDELLTYSLRMKPSTTGYHSLIVDGKLLVPNGSSTKYNPRISIYKSELGNHLLQIVTNNFDTCIVKLNNVNLFEESETKTILVQCPEIK